MNRKLVLGVLWWRMVKWELEIKEELKSVVDKNGVIEGDLEECKGNL